MHEMIRQAWGYAPVRWGAIISALTAAAFFVLPGLRMGGGYLTDGFMPHGHCWLRDPG